MAEENNDNVPIAELNTKMEAVAKIVAETQKANEKFGPLSEAVGNLKSTLETSVTEYTELKAAFDKSNAENEANIKRVDTLEMAMSKMPAGSKKDGDIDHEFIAKFVGVIERTSTRDTDGDFFKESAQKLLDHYSTGLSEERKLRLKAALIGSNPDGGYFAPIDISNQINKRVFETSNLREICNVVTTAAEARSSIIDDQENDAGWVGETQDRPSTGTAKVGEKIITVHEMYANPKASQKVLDDALFDVPGWLGNKTSDKFSRLENDSFINGDGAQRPEGILTPSDWASVDGYERGKLGTRETAGAGVIAQDDLIKLQGDLFEKYQTRGTFAFHRKIWTSSIVTLKDSNGRYLLDPMLLFRGAELQMLGKPVKLWGDMPSTIATGVYAGLYGDFMEGYTVVDRIGIRVLRDPYTDKPFILFYTTKRVGGGVTNYQAIKRLKIQ